jgi:hypothetical protein
VELSNRVLESKATQSFLHLRAEALSKNAVADPRYEAHLRAALAFVRGMREHAFSMVHVRDLRPPRA